MIEAPELLQFLSAEETRARDNTLDDQRAALLGFYNGEPYGDEEDGRSQLVTRDVAEVVDHMVVGVLRTMVSGDKVVEFEDSGDDEEGAGASEGPQQPVQPQMGGLPDRPKRNKITKAQEATEAIHYLFMKKGRGYVVLHDALKAGLLEKTGWVKTYPEKQPHKRHEAVIPAELLQGSGAHEAEPVDPANEEGDWRIAIHEPQAPKQCSVSVPNEEMLVAPDVRDLVDPVYIAQRTPKTLSDLREMDFDVDDSVGSSDGYIDAGLSNAREGDRSYYDQEVEREGANRRVWLLEEYARFDVNGDGIAERVCVHRVGRTILSIEEADEHPFEYWCPFPMQHRLVGQALADKVADIQRTNSVLLRNAMDSLYIGLAPRTFVNEGAIGENTIDDLLTVRPNAIVRWKGNVEPRTLVNQDTSATAFQAIEFMIGQRESRTGITRHNQGLDADTLNKTATGMALQTAAGEQIQEYVARNFAELLVAPLFAKMYRQLRQFGQPFPMKIDGQKIMVDPRAWPEEIDITVRVGLGSGRKDQRLQYRMELLNIQQAGMAAGLAEVTPDKIYNSVKGLIEDTGLGDVDQFWADPANSPPAQPKPDPEMAKVQAELQMSAQKQGHEQELAQSRLEMDGQVNALKLQQMRETADQQSQLAHGKAAFEADLAERKFQAEMELAARRQEGEMALAQMKHAHDAEMAKAKISNDREGGRLDA
jgi:hypothetical protein